MGEVALKANLTKAPPHFEKRIAVLREIKAENELALTYADYGRFHKQKGQIAQAQEYLTKAMEIFERHGTLLEPDKARKHLTRNCMFLLCIRSFEVGSELVISFFNRGKSFFEDLPFSF